MALKDEIKIYNGREEIEADYEAFIGDWKHDRDNESAEHKSGLKLRKVYFFDRPKIEYANYPDWVGKMEDLGLSKEETQLYLRMIKNQFVVLTEKNPAVEKELSVEEQVKLMEKSDAFKIKMAREYHHFSEERVQEMEKHLRERREEYLKNGGWKHDSKGFDR